MNFWSGIGKGFKALGHNFMENMRENRIFGNVDEDGAIWEHPPGDPDGMGGPARQRKRGIKPLIKPGYLPRLFDRMDRRKRMRDFTPTLNSDPITDILLNATDARYTPENGFPMEYAGQFRHGGRLLPGEYGIVGEDGPEVVVSNNDGTTDVIPNLNLPAPSALEAPTQVPAPLPDVQSRPLATMLPTLNEGSSSYVPEPEVVDPNLPTNPPLPVQEHPLARNLRLSMANLARVNSITDDDDLRATYDKKHDSIWKNVGKGMLMGLSKLDPNIFLNPNIPDKTALGYAIGGAIGGGVGNGFIDPLGDERAQHQREIGRAAEQVKIDQGLYGQDIQNRQNEIGIENVESQIGKRAADSAAKIKELDDKLKIANSKLVNQQLGFITSRYNKATTFGDSPEDQAASDFYKMHTGVPLAKKTADVINVEDLPDASSERLMRRITYKNGRTEQGWVKDDGSLTTNRAEAARYVAPSVIAAQIGGDARIKSAEIYSQAQLTGIREKIAADIKQSSFKSQEEYAKARAAIMGTKIYGADDAMIQSMLDDLESKYPQYKE